MRSVLSAEVHVVATVRDFAALLPAEWQETVKCRGTTGWEAWLDEVIATGKAADRRRRSWFWRVHDTLAILDLWCRHISPDQVHVITVPRQDSAGLLWTRFAAVTGIDPGGCDLTRARRNSSLGPAETEFLLRMNQALPAEMPYWFYTREIKQILAHGVLSARPHRSRLALPPSQHAWAAEQAEILIAGLRDAKYHVVGDLAELRPADLAGPHAGIASQPSSNSKPPYRPWWPWPTATTRCGTRPGSDSCPAAPGGGPATSSGLCSARSGGCSAAPVTVRPCGACA